MADRLIPHDIPRSSYRRPVRCAALIIMLACVYIPASAQDAEIDTAAKGPSIWDVMYSDIEIVVEDGVAFGTEPARFETSDWIYTGALFAGTLFTMTQDAELRAVRLRNNKVSPDIQSVLDFGTEYGNIFDASVGASALYLTGLIMDVYYDGGLFQKGELRKIARMVGEALFFSGSVAAVTRSLLGRPRPYWFKSGEEEVWKFDLLNMKTSKNAFPSGHSVVTMALTTSLAEYLDSWIARAILYPAAILGLAARIATDGHWSSDIVFGAGLGVAGGIYMAAKERKRDLNDMGTTPNALQDEVLLYPVPGGMGLLIRF